MVRVISRVVGAIGTLLLMFLALMAYTFSGMGANTAEAWPGVGYSILDGYVSVGVIELGAGKVALVDAGNDTTGAALLAGLAEHGHSAEDVTAILLTHGHPDHTSGLGLFPTARVFAMQAEVPYVAGERRFDGPLPWVMGPRTFGKVTHPVMDGVKMTLGERQIQGFLVPGHTHGSAAWLIDGVLFVGDTASLNTSGQLIGAPWVFSDSVAENRASIAALQKKLAGQTITRIVTSHTGGADGGAALAAFQAE